MWDIFRLCEFILNENNRLSHVVAYLLFMPAAALIAVGLSAAADASVRWPLPAGLGLLALCIGLFILGLWNEARENHERYKKSTTRRRSSTRR